MSVDPACWSWPTERPTENPLTQYGFDVPLEDDLLIDVWQDGRCAVCGGRKRLLLDHDHETALIRGLLCCSCNTLEGRGSDPLGVFAKYRWRNPATILGVITRYIDPMSRLPAVPQPPPPDDIWSDNPAKWFGL